MKRTAGLYESSRAVITVDSLPRVSSTAAGEIEVQHANQKVTKVDHKNEDFSKSVNSFDTGPIFPARLGYQLSRNVGPVSIYAFLKNPSWRIGSLMVPKNERIFWKSVVCQAEVEFQRPCRGLSPGKGFAPKHATYYMTRRAFLALRVIQRQGKLRFNMLVKK